MRKKKHLQGKSKRREREECENSRDFIVKRKWVDVFWGDLVERST
jgi:hypothetical protein